MNEPNGRDVLDEILEPTGEYENASVQLDRTIQVRFLGPRELLIFLCGKLSDSFAITAIKENPESDFSWRLYAVAPTQKIRAEMHAHVEDLQRRLEAQHKRQESIGQFRQRLAEIDTKHQAGND